MRKSSSAASQLLRDLKTPSLEWNTGASAANPRLFEQLPKISDDAGTWASSYTGPMEVNLSPDLEGKLARAAGRRGISADVLIREAIERAVDYDDWFIREVEKGLAQIDAGQVLTHDAVGARLEQKLAEHQSRR